MKTPNELWEEWWNGVVARAAFGHNPFYADEISPADTKVCFLAGLRQGLMLASEKAELMPINDPEGPWFNHDMTYAADEIAAELKKMAEEI